MQRAFVCSRAGWVATSVVLSCLLALAASACGDDDEEPRRPSRKDAGSEKDTNDELPGMAIPQAGRSGSGGRDGSSSSGRAGASGTDAADAADAADAIGGMGGTGGESDPNASAYTCVPRAADVGSTSESGAACCGELGTCTTASEQTRAGFPHETCKAQPDLRCVPKPPEADADAGTSSGFASCRVQLPGSPATGPSWEGRCLANCFVQASPIRTRLSRATCAEGETCAPCYNPLNGRTTGACELPGDSPLELAPVPFAACGENDLGYCVPAFAAGNSAGQLAQITCAAGELCAPKAKVGDPGACFEHCDSGDFGPGACAPAFLAGSLSSFLTRGSCGAGELCLPCSALGARTGVCD